MKADWYTVEESAALRRAIYPNYPDTRNPCYVRDPQQWLTDYRAKHPEKADHIPASK